MKVFVPIILALTFVTFNVPSASAKLVSLNRMKRDKASSSEVGTSTEPPSTTTVPPSTSTVPPSNSTEPPSNSTEPPSTSTEPPIGLPSTEIPEFPGLGLPVQAKSNSTNSTVLQDLPLPKEILTKLANGILSLVKSSGNTTTGPSKGLSEAAHAKNEEKKAEKAKEKAEKAEKKADSAEEKPKSSEV